MRAGTAPPIEPSAGSSGPTSVLFPPGTRAPDDRAADPGYFDDLNLGQLVDVILAGYEQFELRPFFAGLLDDEDAVRYRHEVFCDLERVGLLDRVVEFSRSMEMVRSHLAREKKLDHVHQAARWHLEAARLYVEGLSNLHRALATAELCSDGFRSVAAHIESVVASPGFTALAAACREVRDRLSTIRYTVLVDGLRVTVRRYEGEEDHSAQVQDTFERFRQGAVRDHRVELKEWAVMNHVEAKILDRVALLFSAEFGALGSFRARWPSFCDPTVLRFDREVQFYVSYLRWMVPLRRAGLRFCYPEMVRGAPRTFASDAFDVALAGKLVHESAPVVTNDFRLDDPERVLVVTGPNQGGKTTFARMFGQLHHLGALGCPVPGSTARLRLCDRIFTHFVREEDLSSTGGKLEDDIARMRGILLSATADSVLVVNEIFSSTTLSDATFLGRETIRRAEELGLLCVYVTFVDELASLAPCTVSMMSTVVPEDPSRRTYKVVRRPADGRAYAEAIARKHGLTYHQLKERLGR